MANVKADIDSGPFFYWRVMRALQKAHGEFASRIVVDIAGDKHRKTIEHYVEFLLRERVIEIVRFTKRGAAQTAHYRIINDGDAPPLRRQSEEGLGRRQQALWNGIRTLRSFRASELAVVCSTAAMKIPRETASGYARDLLRAGYLVQIDGDASLPTYRLSPGHNTGPRAPIVLRSKQACFDLNLMREVNLSGSTTVGRAA